MPQRSDILNNPAVEIESVNQGKDNEIRFNTAQLKPGTFKNILIYYDSISTSPVEYLLTGLLASLSCAIGKNAYYRITDNLNIYLNIWGVIIGKSTIMRKTTAIDLTTNDLQRIDLKNYRQYENDYSDYQQKVKQNNSQSTDVLVEPRREYLLFPQDSTIESLSDILSASERGLLTHSEFGSFLQQLNRGYSGDSKQFLTVIFDVPRKYEVSRVTKKNTLLERPYLSILGASTIDWVQEASTASDIRSGFFARFIYAIRNVPDKRFIPLLRLSEITRQSENYIDTRKIFERLTMIPEPVELRINKKAADLHIEYDIEAYKELLNSENENELSFKARLLIYALKFAAIIALADNRQTVNTNDMTDAIVIVEYYKRNVERLLNDELPRNEFQRNEEKMILKIKSAEGGKILRSNLLTSLHWTKKELDEVADNLIEKGLIEEIPEKHKYNKKITRYYRLMNE